MTESNSPENLPRDPEPSVVVCDRCQKTLDRSKVIQDKGANYPELIKQAKEDDRDFVNLCPTCADVEMVGEEENDNNLNKNMSNVRQFL